VELDFREFRDDFFSRGARLAELPYGSNRQVGALRDIRRIGVGIEVVVVETEEMPPIPIE
jgi:hypothetical protein